MVLRKDTFKRRFEAGLKVTRRMHRLLRLVSSIFSTRVRRSTCTWVCQQFSVVVVARTESRIKLTYRLSARRKKKAEDGKWPQRERERYKRGSERSFGPKGRNTWERHDDDNEVDYYYYYLSHARFESSARFNYKSYEVLDYNPQGN